MTSPYRIPIEQLEAQSQVAEVDQVRLVGDGAGPVTTPPGPLGDDGDGD